MTKVKPFEFQICTNLLSPVVLAVEKTQPFLWVYVAMPLFNFNWVPCTNAFIEISLNRSEAEFKEFEPRLKFKPPLKYGWFHLKLYSIFQDLSRRLIETGFCGILDF